MEKKAVKGIGGLLAFYIMFIGLAFFSFLTGALSFVFQEGVSINFFSLGYLFFNFTLMGMIFTSFISIMSEKKKAIKRNKHLLWFWLISNLIIYLFFLMIILYGKVQEPIGISMNGLYILAMTIAWLFYWNKSQRVKNTFIR